MTHSFLNSSSFNIIIHHHQNLLNRIDISFLIIALKHFYSWNTTQAEQACQRYLNFLYLMWLYPNRPLIPTQEIDRVWHCHILHTRQYREDCQTLFGSYLDHEPCLHPEQSFDASLLPAFEQTKFLFERHFGVGSFDSYFGDGCCSQDPAACGRPVL